MIENSRISGFLFVCLFAIPSIQSSMAVIYYNDLYLYLGHSFDTTPINVRAPEANLSTRNFDNKAQSISYNGVWILYEHPNFNQDSEGLVIWRNGTDKKEVLERGGISGRISSARPSGRIYSGSVYDYWDTVKITFYMGRNFTGSQTKMIGGSVPSLEFPNAQSLILIGKGVSWTFYDDVEFFGRAYCLTTKEVVSYYPNPDALEFPLGAIKSVETGCWSKRGVPLPPSAGIKTHQ